MTSTQVRNWVLGIGGGIAVAVGGYFTARTPSTEKAPSTPTVEIAISTENEKPLIFQMSTATVDIQFTGKPLDAREKNLLDPQWVNQIKALGFDRMSVFADGSIMQNAHIKTDGTGKGYNGSAADFPNQQAFKDWGGGVLVANWQSDFFKKTVDFVHAVGLPADVTLNKRDSWAQNKFRIDNSDGEYIKLWSEGLIIEGQTWQDYLTWSIATRDSIKKYYGETKKIIADLGLLDRTNRATLEWRNINPTSLTGIYGGDNYWQINDQIKLTDNQDSNVLRVNRFFDTLVPAQISLFKTLYPGWKIVVGQVNIADNRDGNEIAQPTNKNIVGVYAWGRFYKMFVDNQDIQPCAIQETLKSLNNPNDNNTKIISLLNKLLLKPGFDVTTLTLTGMSGCTGVSLQDDSDFKKHTILINNSSKNTYIVTSLKINDKKKTASSYTIQRMYAETPDWNAATLKDSVTQTNITILPCSVNIINFSTGTPTSESRIQSTQK